ncbi:hypothetical protein DKM44_11575 [Deinococcus irradiatisoli]|uniref:Uncharacterized protein n=1 Tax=Deinococcus irradiatisoli TaxID=2202254 RepID=A0A2Z3JFN4_9DEIO|nr:hypothetical protein [Deinococcus irradiatisoli]AWN23785.1 hypothetical protein DKM44_11575 [Deinococcus irradiatisoli]
MTYTLQAAARHHIESRFRAAVDRDVSGVAAEECQRRGLITPEGTPAERLCLGSHPALADLLFRRLSYDWSRVVYVYDGTRREQALYLKAKLDLTVALAGSGDELTPEVEQRLQTALGALERLWQVWAGYQATTTDDLSLAVDEFGDVI